MEPKDYIVTRIEGEYAYLRRTDEPSEDELFVAMALLPPGIDVGTKAEIYNIMRELTKQGISIIMASSDMPELVNVSDRVLVLSSGKIQGELKGEEITQSNVMKLAIL